MDMQGSVINSFGKRGQENGDFNFPTELRLDGPDLIVVDAMNFRVQVFDRSGTFRYTIGKIGSDTGAVFRPKAVGVDSEGDLYVVDALWSVVQAFNRQGDLLYYFGGKGVLPGQFQLPSGMFIDHDDRIYVVDSFNRRIQVFRFYSIKKTTKDGM
jgi:sugar lactone lactonase YvrE